MRKRGCNGPGKYGVPAGLLFLLLIATGCGYPFMFDPGIYSFASSCDLDRNYEWYKTQSGTGPYAGANCGPASVAMAAGFYRNADIPVADIRKLTGDRGGWWSGDDVKQALSRFHVGYRTNQLYIKEQLFSALSKGHIVIVCLNMSLLTEAAQIPETKYNRYYEHVTGHFIVIKGYSEDRNWLSVYDPNTWQNDYYFDGTPKGKNRLYSVFEVMRSMASWNSEFIELEG
ncbi:MAG: C39 family peptidase [Spirochaetales bacterium]|nr:C39 family peptidase [Spirochaetales bacterium]